MSVGLPSRAYSGYSARLRLHLVMNGKAHPLVKMGKSMCVLREPCTLPAGDAEIVFDVDDSTRRWAIRLPRPIEPPTTRIDFEDR